MMELRVLQYFLAVAREQSLSGAAEFLHLSQPTLSRQLRDLEDELGKQLFIRGNRGIVLTEEGMIPVSYTHLQDIIPGRGVDAADGLIQQVEPGVAAHDQDQLHLLLGALGQALNGRVQGDVQPLDVYKRQI